MIGQHARGRGAGTARSVLLLTLLVGLAGCAGSTRPAVDEALARRDYTAAIRQASKDAAVGAAELERFLRTHPRSRLADDAGLRLAELHLDAGASVAAERTLEHVVRVHPTGDKTDRARLMLARLLMERGKTAQAFAVAREVRLGRVDAAARRDAQRLLVDLASANGDATEQLRWLERLRSDSSGATASAADAEIDQVLMGLTDAELRDVARRLGKESPAARVWLRKAELAAAAGDPDTAQEAIERASALPLSPADAEALRRVQGRMAGGDARRLLASPRRGGSAGVALGPVSGTIGVVLPLSGRYASFGEASLKGILLATGHFSENPGSGRSGIELLVRDTGGSADRAAAAVRELAGRAEVSAVVGPLLAAESEAAAAAAQEVGIPLLTLSRRESVADGRPAVLRFGETPRLDAELMAAYAVETLGIKRFAILYPDIAFGRTVRAAFWDAVEARGGEIVGAARYAPEATDFAKPIRRLVGYEMLSRSAITALRERDRMRKRAKRLPPDAAAELRAEADALTDAGGEPLPPFVDFDAIFIPDTYEMVGLIAPHLAFHEVSGVRLLGTSAWNNAEILRLGGRHLDGAIFTAGSNAASRELGLAEFGSRFEASFHEAPDDMAASAFDAATLAVLGTARAARDRDGLLEALRALDRWPGMSGTIGFESDGSMWKRPHLMGIERGELVSVDERGEPPYLRMRDRNLHCEEGPGGRQRCTAPPASRGRGTFSRPTVDRGR